MKKYQILFVFIGAVLMSGCFGEDLGELKAIVEANNQKEPAPKSEPENEDTARLGSIETVDLGLSVKWATKNLGANDIYSLGNKYTLIYDGVYAKTIDIMGTPYDPVYSIDNTGNTHLPSYAEWYELRDNCSWKYEMNGAHIGFRVTGNNGNSIFFPMDINNLSHTTFDYWTGTVSTTYTASGYNYYYLCRISYSSGSPDISFTNVSSINSYYVRPVQKK